MTNLVLERNICGVKGQTQKKKKISTGEILKFQRH